MKNRLITTLLNLVACGSITLSASAQERAAHKLITRTGAKIAALVDPLTISLGTETVDEKLARVDSLKEEFKTSMQTLVSAGFAIQRPGILQKALDLSAALPADLIAFLIDLGANVSAPDAVAILTPLQQASRLLEVKKAQLNRFWGPTSQIGKNWGTQRSFALQEIQAIEGSMQFISDRLDAAA